MNVGVALLPFIPAEIAAPVIPGSATGAAPAQTAAQSTAQTLPAELVAFAGLLALAIQPAAAGARLIGGAVGATATPGAEESSGAEDSADTAASDETPAVTHSHDEPRTFGTAGDVSGIANTLNASMIVRDLGALQPQFRTKLERVMSRMSNEYGHSVSVAETYRSQARQDQLLQQGRTTSGPIVTWTSHSLHTQGRAADLLVDGKWNNPEGFRHLQEIASQEGLSTLGPRDPGHVELREDSIATIASMAQITEIGVSSVAASGTPARTMPAIVATPIDPAEPTLPIRVSPDTRSVQSSPVAQADPVTQTATVAHVAQIAQVAQVAPLARVAQVAQIAHVAQVAQAGYAASSTPQSTLAMQSASPLQATIAAHPQSPAQKASPASTASPGSDQSIARGSAKFGASAATSAAQPVRRSPEGDAESSSGRRERHRDPSTAQAIDGSSDAAAPQQDSQQAALTAQPVTIATDSMIQGAGVDAIVPSGAAARAAAVLALQDTRDAQPVSHMMLQLDNGNGGLDRIRVGLHGNSVGATIDMRDPVAATELAGNIHQLANALQSRGLDADSLRVRVAGSIAPAPAADIARAVAAAGDPAASARGTLFAQEASSSSRSREDAPGQRSHQDSSRQRTRKDQQGDQK